jgi:hypothetical protein
LLIYSKNKNNCEMLHDGDEGCDPRKIFVLLSGYLTVINTYMVSFYTPLNLR